MNRRNFVTLSALALADLAIGGPVACSTRGPLVTDDYAAHPSKKGRVLLCLRTSEKHRSRFRLFDWDDHSYTEVEIPIGMVHSVVHDEYDPNVIYFFEIFGSCLRYDFKKKTSVVVDHRGKPEMFSGHGALTTSREFIACTEIDRARGSVVTLRTAEKMGKVLVMPDECKSAHQVVALPNSSLVAMGNMRSRDGKPELGGITFYDTEKRHVVNRVDFDYPILHLMPISPTEVVGISIVTRHERDRKYSLSTAVDTNTNIDTFSATQSFLPGPVVYASTDGQSKLMWDEKNKDMFRDNFSLAKIDRTKFFSGHHQAGKVIYWEDFKMKKMFDVPRAKNLIVSRDRTQLLALSQERLMIYSLDTYEPIKSFDDWPDIICFSGYS